MSKFCKFISVFFGGLLCACGVLFLIWYCSGGCAKIIIGIINLFGGGI